MQNQGQNQSKDRLSLANERKTKIASPKKTKRRKNRNENLRKLPIKELIIDKRVFLKFKTNKKIHSHKHFILDIYFFIQTKISTKVNYK
jgi:hypothetical protein